MNPGERETGYHFSENFSDFEQTEVQLGVGLTSVARKVTCMNCESKMFPIKTLIDVIKFTKSGIEPSRILTIMFICHRCGDLKA